MRIAHVPGDQSPVFEDAVVVGGASMVFTRDLQTAFTPAPFDHTQSLFDEETAERFVRSTQGGEISFEFKRPPEIIAQVSREVIPLNLLHSHNYFHFLLEWLPSLMAFIAQGRLSDRAMIATGMLHPNMWHALDLLIRRYRLPVLQLKAFQGIVCERAIQLRPSWLGSELIAGGSSNYSFHGPNLELLRRSFKQLWPDAAARRKLFIRRQSGIRQIVNVREVEAAAIAAGYEIVDPADLTFMEQMALFNGASHIVGPTGAWAANLAFAPDGAKVGILYSEAVRTSRPLWNPLGVVFNLDMAHLYCPVPQLADRAKMHADFIVPPDGLEALLRR